MPAPPKSSTPQPEISEKFVSTNTNRPGRLLDGIPGIMVIVAFVIALSMAILVPRTALALAAVWAVYSVVRFLLIAVAYIYGLKYVQEADAIDWHKRYNENHDYMSLAWADVHHVVIIPNYVEPIELLRKTLSNLALSPQSQQMTVVLAMEASEANSVEKGIQLKAEFASAFANVFYTVHPADLPGEMRCKSANQAWAAQWAQHTLIDELGYDPDCIVVTTMDADTLWHKDYFTALTYHFATDPQRHRRFWQAPIRYHGNIYQISPLLRFSNIYSNALELGYLAAGWWDSLPISSYSLSLRLLLASGNWDTDVIADEWHMYIKAFFAHQGDLKPMPIYLPFLATAVTGETLWDALRNRYMQTLRHSWGAKEIGYTIAQIRANPQVSRRESLKLLFVVGHDLTQASAMWVFLTLASQLPILLHPSLLGELLADPFGFPPFIILQLVLIVMTLWGLTLLWLDVQAWPERSSPPTRQEYVLLVLGFLLLPLLGVLFVILPVLHAQIQLLAGRQISFQVTMKA